MQIKKILSQRELLFFFFNFFFTVSLMHLCWKESKWVIYEQFLEEWLSHDKESYMLLLLYGGGDIWDKEDFY
jgi:hypothetical protein